MATDRALRQRSTAINVRGFLLCYFIAKLKVHFYVFIFKKKKKAKVDHMYNCGKRIARHNINTRPVVFYEKVHFCCIATHFNS